MKLRLVLAFAGLAIGFAAPALAQQTKTSVSDEDRQQIEASIVKKLEEACNKNDAAAVPAVFTEDAVQVAPEGLFSGRQAIEKRYADVFQQWHLTNYISKGDQLNAIGNEAWAVGEWSCTLQGQNGSVQVKGYDSGIYVREGDTWKIRMSTFNVAPLLPRSRWKEASLRLDAPHLNAPRLIVGSSFMGPRQLRSFFAAAASGGRA